MAAARGTDGNAALRSSPWVGNAVPFLVKSPSQFRTAGPHPLDSAAHAADLNEVKAMGASNSVTRTADQTYAAAFWQTNPAANYNAVARGFVDQLSLDLSDSARLFAVLEARIWAGIHFRNPDVQAAALGHDGERYIHKHFFASVH